MANSRKLKPNWPRLLNWAPVFVWMIVIFVFSSDYFSAANTAPFLVPLLSNLFPGLAAPHIENIVLSIRKSGHFSEYLIFGILLLRALSARFPRQSAKRRITWSIALTAVYACSDELHQMFVPSRTASLVDVLIDALGGIFGILWFHLRNRNKRSI